MTLAWHFVGLSRRLRDGTPLRKGRTYRLPPGTVPVMCETGYHASIQPLDALRYAPGPIICRVQLGGTVLEDDDKLCASERTVLWWADATRTLHEFALWCAERALRAERRAGREPDPRLWRALEVKRAWVHGQASDQELDAAWATASAASRTTASDTASAAAWAAVWATASVAVRSAVLSAASAARDAASDTAWGAIRDAQNRKLSRMLLALSRANPARAD
jgi:hypothetical protein